jgi:hypothetical protein
MWLELAHLRAPGASKIMWLVCCPRDQRPKTRETRTSAEYIRLPSRGGRRQLRAAVRGSFRQPRFRTANETAEAGGRRAEIAVRGSSNRLRSLHFAAALCENRNETAEAVCGCVIRRQPGGNLAALFNAEVAKAQRSNLFLLSSYFLFSVNHETRSSLQLRSSPIPLANDSFLTAFFLLLRHFLFLLHLLILLAATQLGDFSSSRHGQVFREQ